MHSSDTNTPQVLFVTRYFYPFIGGMEKQAHTLAATLVGQGRNIQVVTSRVYQSWPAREILDGITIIRLPSVHFKYIGAVFFLVNLIIYFFKNRKRREIIHAFQIGYTSAAAIMLAKFFKKPSVLKLACSGTGGDIQNNQKSVLGRLFLFFCKNAHAIIVLNKEMQQELAATGYPSDKIFCIPNGVDINAYAPAADRQYIRHALGIPEVKIIIYTGRILFVQKRLDLLVHAIAKINNVPPFRLYIIGQGPDELALDLLCLQLRLYDRVRILKTVEASAPFLQTADIFALPSRYEGLSNSLLEAMGCGLAVVATDIAGNRELVEDGVTGVLVPCDDEEKLISALESLIMNETKAACLGSNAREKVCRQYAIETVARKYRQLYDRMVRGKSTELSVLSGSSECRR